ncbi:RING-type E3 ubiquitin transferase [Salvia divinorum]|uniref:RING-type E3 ubiquitin transferase n=1 Tax=Salvia divinorum TaxID=28513 RepID=A0ABD1G099_SALDI
MASFQVEIVPYFQNNLNNLDLGDLWVHHPQWQTPTASDDTPPCSSNNNNNESTHACSDKQCNNKWARAREIVFPADAADASAGGASPARPGNPHAGGVSSLVQRWRGFERGAPPPPPLPPSAALAMDDDSVIGDWESDRTVLSGRSSIRGRDSDATESERLRVSDIIRKLTPNEAGFVSPPRSWTSIDNTDPRPMPSPAPRIRGRQAYLDLLARRERDRRREIDAVHARKSVSKFPHRGRIQAVLKLRLLRRGMEGFPIEPHIPRPRVNQKWQSTTAVHFEKEAKDKTANDEASKQDNRCSNGKSCLRAQQDIIHYEETTHIKQETRVNTGEETSRSKESNKQDGDDDNGGGDQAASSTSSNQLQMVETEAYWVADFAHPEEGWEELQSREENNTDWIEQVSRPRSDWECLRQERYQEMLDPFAENEEIRLLLCRKSVSNFLSSKLKDKIDQLMICRSQGDQRQDNKVFKEGGGGDHQEAKCLDEYDQEGDQECHEYVDASATTPRVDQNESEKQKCEEPSECSYQAASPSTPYAEIEMNESDKQKCEEPSECSYQAASPSTPQSSTNYCSQDMTGRTSTFSAHPTFEMEIIYDLRRHMEQLHQEISELRKSMKFCTDMQVKMHRSIKKEVATALTHPDAKNGRRHPVKRGASNGRRCCLCCKVQVDCVLYRCGHMCTCFDCANRLHWSGGGCPVCRAQILDVVRTQSNF